MVGLGKRLKFILTFTLLSGLAACGEPERPPETPPAPPDTSMTMDGTQPAQEPIEGETLADDIVPELLGESTPVAPSEMNPPASTAAKSQTLFDHPQYGYELVIVIDKAKQGTSPTAQTLSVWSYHDDPQNPKLLATLKTSTGAESRAVSVSGKITNRITKVGYFQMQRLYPGRTYVSKTWDAEMPWAMFYDLSGGYAIHATSPATYHLLGKRASGGCSRLTLEQAEWLLNWVQYTGKGPVLALNSKTGQPRRDSRGQWITRNGYKTLVIIQDHSQN